MAESENANTAEKLRAILETGDAANAMTHPLTESIEHLLRITANSLNSEEASIIIRDGDEGDLKFLSAVGQVADKLIGIKIPAGKGIAGFVFSSGQPMVVGDVGQEESFYAEIDKKTGYETQTILATPLRYKDEIIGVLEYVNRIGEPPYAPFSPDEMDKAAIYAEAFASLINAYEASQIIYEFGEKMFSGGDKIERLMLGEWLRSIRSTTEHKEMIELAILVREISVRGEDERKFCREILETFLRYSESGKESSFLSF